MGIKSREKRERRRCYICGTPLRKVKGAENQRTRDHIPPKGWLSPPLPRNLLTLKACARCQQDSSAAEERIRNVMAGAFNHEPGAFVAAFNKASRSVQRQPLVLDRGFYRDASGLFLKADLVAPEQPDFELVFGKVTRGLFFKLLHRPLGNVPMSVRVLGQNDADRLSQAVLVRHRARVIPISKELSFAFLLEEGDLDSSLWLYLVFASGVVAVMTGRPTGILNLPWATAIAVRS